MNRSRLERINGYILVIDPLLSTKLFMPLLRGGLVPRARLLDRLGGKLWQAGGFSRKLTLVSAPAGYGKTTLVVEWLSNFRFSIVDFGLGDPPIQNPKPKTQNPVAWLSLDESDNDPARFMAYLLAALQQVQPEFGESTRALLQLPQPPSEAVILTTLLNELAAIPAPFVLALDDYHAIHTPAIHAQLTFILDHQPPYMHMVLITREDPLLPIPRLRARGQAMEIRQDELQFTTPETVDFLGRVMGLALSSEEIAALERRTEGWIAGLQLAAIAMQSPLSMRGHDDLSGFVQAFTGSSRFILDYLIEEVFDRQTPEVKDFLLETSILERLSGPLCDAVTEKTNSQELLEALEQANLFIVSLDQSRTWYRYHHLFAELLRHRLRTSEMHEEALLHRRASRWLETGGYLTDAVQHALAAQDWATAARLIGQASDGMLRRGEIATLLGWFGKLPREVAGADPRLCMVYAWAALLASQLDLAGQLLEHAEGLAQPGTHFLGQVAAAQAYLARSLGDNPRLIEKSRQALSLLPETDLTTRGLVAINLGLAYWHEGRLEEAEPVLLEAREASGRVSNHFVVLTAQVFLARTLAARGKLRQAEAMCRKIIQEGGNVPILALAYYDLYTIYYEWNDLQKAEEHLQHGMELSLRSGNMEFQNAGHIYQALLRLAQGDPAGALAAVEQSHALARDLAPAVRARSAACHVRLALALGDLETAQRWGEQLAGNADAHSFYRFLGLARPLLLIAMGEKAAAAGQLAACYATASHAGWGYAAIAVRVLQSLAAPNPEAAVEFLSDALKLAQPEGYLRTFVEAGEPLILLLQEAARRGVHPEYVGQILAAREGERRTRSHRPIFPANAALVEPLSGRELEVLRLVTAGLSNREIAAQLFISPGTAKTHIHNIFGKLGARNRMETVIKAKELGLV